MSEVTNVDLVSIEDENTNDIIEAESIDVSATNAENETNIPSSQGLTSPCSSCGKVTTKKDCVLECSKCKNLTHYSCSRLPGYAIFSLKKSKRQHVCETCSDTPDDFTHSFEPPTLVILKLGERVLMHTSRIKCVA